LKEKENVLLCVPELSIDNFYEVYLSTFLEV